MITSGCYAVGIMINSNSEQQIPSVFAQSSFSAGLTIRQCGAYIYTYVIWTGFECKRRPALNICPKTNHALYFIRRISRRFRVIKMNEKAIIRKLTWPACRSKTKYVPENVKFPLRMIRVRIVNVKWDGGQQLIIKMPMSFSSWISKATKSALCTPLWGELGHQKRRLCFTLTHDNHKYLLKRLVVTP